MLWFSHLSFSPYFWQDFYPRYDVTTPADVTNLMASLAREYYANLYQESTGIVNFPHPQILCEALIEIPTGRQTNPHIQFFEETPAID